MGAAANRPKRLEVVLHPLRRPRHQRHLGRADVGGVGEHLPARCRRRARPCGSRGTRCAAELDGVGDIEAGIEGDHAGVQPRGQGEGLEHRAQLIDRARAAIDPLVIGRLARRVGIEVGLAGEAKDFAGLHIDHHADAAEGVELGHRLGQLVVQSGLDAQVHRQRHRLAARGLLDRAVQPQLGPRQARAALVGEADHVGRGRAERIDAALLFLEGHARQAHVLQLGLLVGGQAADQVFAAVRPHRLVQPLAAAGPAGPR